MSNDLLGRIMSLPAMDLISAVTIRKLDEPVYITQKTETFFASTVMLCTKLKLLMICAALPCVSLVGELTYIENRSRSTNRRSHQDSH